VVEVIHRHNEIDAMTEQELDAWYAGCGFPDGNRLEAKDLVSLCKLVAVWQFLPLEEVRRECVGKGLLEADSAVSDEAQRPELVDQLLIHERMGAWEAMGLPAWRIGEAQAVAQLVHDCQAIGVLSVQELQDWYDGLELPVDSSMAQEELRRLRRACLVWSALPVHELHTECVSLGVEIPVTNTHESSDEQRSCLVYALLLHDRMKKSDLQGLDTQRRGHIETVVQLDSTCCESPHQCTEGDEKELAIACAEQMLDLPGKTSPPEASVNSTESDSVDGVDNHTSAEANMNSTVFQSNDCVANQLVKLEARVNESSKEVAGTPKVGTLAFEAFLDERGSGSSRLWLQEELSELQDICAQMS